MLYNKTYVKVRTNKGNIKVRHLIYIYYHDHTWNKTENTYLSCTYLDKWLIDKLYATYTAYIFGEVNLKCHKLFVKNILNFNYLFKTSPIICLKMKYFSF